MAEQTPSTRRFLAILRSGDAAEMRELLALDPWLREHIDEPWGYFDAPALVEASSRGDAEMMRVLVEAGADVNARSGWEPGGSGVLDGEHVDLWVKHRRDDGSPVMTELFDDFRRRGLTVDAHAAANLGDTEMLRRLIDDRPECVNERGRDGASPLHMARTPEIVDLLVDRGADVDMRDIDHGATPAQWAIDEPAVCGRMIERGATPDIYVACALGDITNADRVLAIYPDALRSRSNHGPHMNGRPPGGHMYIYRMGVAMRPLPFASTKGHDEFVEQLLMRAEPAEQLIHAAWTGDRSRALSLVARHPGLVESLAPDEARAISDAAWNNNCAGVALMLEVGFPVDARGDDDGTPLDRAAVRGYADIVEVLLGHQPSLGVTNDFGGTPLGGAIWGAGNFRDPKGDYARTVHLLAAADPDLNRVGDDGHTHLDRALASSREDVADALRRHGGRGAAELAGG
ncbi:MAG: ankyrin repeat domain-containing protein [Chloroflexota bacterium]|nr:ankyrin repeat domain-containing protein [Chloroflexota bacterium]MDE2898722.1 ankyrin repeat domain-containing protein [Chloroflexota bacterium]